MSAHYYLFLVVFMVLLSAFGSFVNDMYLPCLPDMVKVFGCTVSQIQLSLTMGMIGLGVGEILFGPISDKYGRKPVLYFALVLFLVFAVISIFSRTLIFFLICRLVQGIGGSAGYFLARTIPADVFGGRRLAKFMGVIGAINGLAPALAPTLGGLMADSVGWKGIFLVLAGFSVVLLVLNHFFKETLPPERRDKGSLMKSFESYGRLLTNKRFMAHVMFKDVALGLLFAYISSSPFIIQTHFGYTPVAFGIFIGVNALLLGVGSLVASRFRVLKNAGFIGAWIMSLAMIGECFVLFYVDSFWAFELLLLPVLFSAGMIFCVGNTLAMNEGRNDAGVASGLLGVFGYIVGAIVSPLVGIGNIMHSTAWVFLILAVIVLLISFYTHSLPDDLNQSPS